MKWLETYCTSHLPALSPKDPRRRCKYQCAQNLAWRTTTWRGQQGPAKPSRSTDNRKPDPTKCAESKLWKTLLPKTAIHNQSCSLCRPSEARSETKQRDLPHPQLSHFKRLYTTKTTTTQPSFPFTTPRNSPNSQPSQSNSSFPIKPRSHEKIHNTTILTLAQTSSTTTNNNNNNKPLLKTQQRKFLSRQKYRAATKNGIGTGHQTYLHSDKLGQG